MKILRQFGRDLDATFGNAATVTTCPLQKSCHTSKDCFRPIGLSTSGSFWPLATPRDRQLWVVFSRSQQAENGQKQPFARTSQGVGRYTSQLLTTGIARQLNSHLAGNQASEVIEKERLSFSIFQSLDTLPTCQLKRHYGRFFEKDIAWQA
jgi:hypothetical protein